MDAMSVSLARSIELVRSVRESNGSANASGSVWASVLSVSGRGVVFQIGFQSTAAPHKFRVTIDSGTPMTIDTNLAPVYPRPGTDSYVVALNIVFESSLLVEFTHAGASTAGLASVLWGGR